MLEDIARSLNASRVTLPGSPDAPQTLPTSHHSLASTSREYRGYGYGYQSQQNQGLLPLHPQHAHHPQPRLSDQIPVGIRRLNLGLDDPGLAGVGIGVGMGGPTHESRGLSRSGVPSSSSSPASSSTPYGGGSSMARLMAQTRSLERQFA